MHHIKILISLLGHVLGKYGGWGLFAISYLDSSFLAFPVINDLLLIKLSSAHPHNAVWYALACAVGSVAGALTLYFITRRGRNLLSPRTPQKEKTRIRHWIEQNDFLSILVASLLPPPTPFKIFAIMAGVLQIALTRFTLALAIGRGIRFGLEAWVGVEYGVEAQEYLRRNALWLSLVMAGVIVVGVVIYRFIRRPGKPAGGEL
ncbi:MAG: YqaA family protein [Terriglobia bacterium]